MSVQLSANLGFLWTDLSLPDAIGQASESGFDAVECHQPFATPTAEVRDALAETGLRMISLNTETGSRPDDLGVAAIPGREAEARDLIDQAIDYAVAIDCAAISVVAGKSGRTTEAEAAYRQNLSYASESAAPHDITVLIEPLNHNVAADYHLLSADRGAETIKAVGASNLKLMVDCFHSAVMDGDLQPLFERVMPYVGHVQFSSLPDRAEPDHGDVDYATLLPWLNANGYDRPFGAEYTPTTTVEAGLGWMTMFQEESP